MAEERMRRTQPQDEAARTQRPAAREEDTIDLMQLAFRLLDKWKMIACMALAFALLAGAYTVFLVTPMYEATSTIYVLSRSDALLSMSDLQIGTALTQDYIKVFSIWEVHDEVISNLNLPYTPQQMNSMVSVVNDSDTRMLDITFRSPSPQEAADAANEYAKVASEYIANTMATDKPNIMSVALVPTHPVSPSKTRNVMLGFVLGAALACGIVTVQMLMDDKLKTAEEIRIYTGLATLAIVPVEGEDEKVGRKAKGGRRKR